jgi:hypothetical protein
MSGASGIRVGASYGGGAAPPSWVVKDAKLDLKRQRVERRASLGGN